MTTVRALVIRPYEEPAVRDLEWTLEVCQSVVGSDIEEVNPPSGVWSALVAENPGGAEVNGIGTLVARALGWRSGPDLWLLGPMVFFGPVDEEGDPGPVSKELVAVAQAIWAYSEAATQQVRDKV